MFMLFKPMLPVMEYVVLYDYIKTELCVNKDKPELQCNGKCHLKKEMANATDSKNINDKHRFSTAENHIAVCYQIFYPQSTLFFVKSIFKKMYFSYNNIYTFSFTNFIFRPPVLN